MIWTKYNLEREKVYHWKFGTLELFIRKIGKEWQIANKTSETPEESDELANVVPEPENVEWKSFIADKNDSLKILPALPDRPVVIKPDNTFKLMPGKAVQFFINIPVWIQLYSGSAQKENLMFEIPLRELSSTWFGDPDNGILSYSLPKGSYGSLGSNNPKGYEIICPVRITNSSAGQLDFQRLCLHVDFLGIYYDQKYLYTNETRVRYKGENIISDIHYTNQPPPSVENTKQLSSPRNQEKSNVFKKSFHLIKSLTEY
jgi:hypothetical protein